MPVSPFPVYIRQSLSHPVIIFVISYDARRQSPISPDVENVPLNHTPRELQTGNQSICGIQIYPPSKYPDHPITQVLP